MIKKILYTTLLLATVIYISGCGKTEKNTPSDSSTEVYTTSSHATASPYNKDNDEKISSGTSSTSSPENTGNQDNKAEPEITEESLSAEQPYSNINHSIQVLGLKEYNKLKDKKYTDKPAKGKKYLVLFLSIKNMSSEDDYINANYVHGKVDGTETEHTFLVNSPRNYSTIFDHVPSGSTIEGFIVWEVPKNWKKLVFYYDGWQYSDNISLKCTLTKKDLFNPPIYNNANVNTVQ